MNTHRRLTSLFFVLGILLASLSLSATAKPAPMPQASSYDLIAAVNALRASNGLPPLQTDGSLMAAAQSHADYQASIGSWTHTGANGSTPRAGLMQPLLARKDRLHLGKRAQVALPLAWTRCCTACGQMPSTGTR